MIRYSIVLHPKKQILATVSDDHSWKMWAIPGGDIIMTGEGHTDWVADCDFHPRWVSLLTKRRLFSYPYSQLSHFETYQCSNNYKNNLNVTCSGEVNWNKSQVTIS